MRGSGTVSSAEPRTRDGHEGHDAASAASSGLGSDQAAADTLLDCVRHEAGRWSTERLPVSLLASAVATVTGFLWLRLRSPDVSQMEAIAAQLNLPELAVEDAVHAHQRPKL